MVTPSVLLVSGSLRRASTNTALLRSAASRPSQGLECHLYEGLGRLPAFNPDDDGAPLDPEVAHLREQIHGADAILFSTPEYAGALPGSLKNLLDWCIGDPDPRSIYNKPVGWVNTSSRGAEGGHAELRTVLGYAHARIVDGACASVPVTSGMIGIDGYVTDEVAIAKAESLLRALADASVPAPLRP